MASNAVENILHADRASKAALEMSTPVDAIDCEAISLLEHSVAWLQAALETHRHRLHHLSARKLERDNTRAVISRLPTEITCTIFQYDADEHYADRSGAVVEDTWLRLSHVCRQWRRIVFNMPTLWANDLFGFGEGPSVLANLLPLTREAPLNIDLDYDTGPSDVSISEYMQLVARAWRINYHTFTYEDALTLIKALAVEPLPHLQTLVFSASTRRAPDSLLPRLSLAEHPNLRFLTLGNVYMQPPTSGKLLSLEINLYDLPDELKLSIDMLLDVLSQNPSLRCLSLLSGLRRILQVQRGTSRRLSLRCLTYLTLEHSDMLSTYHTLLDQIYTPALQTIRLLDQDMTTGIDNALPIFESSIRAWMPCVRDSSAEAVPRTAGDTLVATYHLSMFHALDWEAYGPAIHNWLEGLSKTFGADFTMEEGKHDDLDFSALCHYVFTYRGKMPAPSTGLQ